MQINWALRVQLITGVNEVTPIRGQIHAQLAINRACSGISFEVCGPISTAMTSRFPVAHFLALRGN